MTQPPKIDLEAGLTSQAQAFLRALREDLELAHAELDLAGVPHPAGVGTLGNRPGGGPEPSLAWRIRWLVREAQSWGLPAPPTSTGQRRGRGDL